MRPRLPLACLIKFPKWRFEVLAGAVINRISHYQLPLGSRVLSMRCRAHYKCHDGKGENGSDHRGLGASQEIGAVLFWEERQNVRVFPISKSIVIEGRPIRLSAISVWRAIANPDVNQFGKYMG